MRRHFWLLCLRFALLGCFLVLFFQFARPVLAFTPYYILSDTEFVDSTAWSTDDVRQFLETKGSPLSRYAPRDVDDTFKKAADVIVTAGLKHRINPKVLLVLLQKEQSLVDGTPEIKNQQSVAAQHRLNWATGYGVCDDCRTTNPALQKFSGFARQVDFAAERLRYFFDHPKEFRIHRGAVVAIDRQAVRPLSQATAALYLYTPHIRGNQNFWIIWNRWFEQLYPDGVILKNQKTEELWYISDGRRRRLADALAQQQLADRAVLSVAPDELLKYRIGNPLTTPPFALVRTPDGATWLLGVDERRRIADASVLRTIGFNPEEIELVPADAIKDYPEGPMIVDALSAATIHLVKSPSSSTVFLIDHGSRRAFLSAGAFKQLGYQWKQVLTVGKDILEQYPAGAPIELSSEADTQKAINAL